MKEVICFLLIGANMASSAVLAAHDQWVKAAYSLVISGVILLFLIYEQVKKLTEDKHGND